MATMNLLKAAYEGSLGQTTGTRWKNKAVVKARIFSKAPPSKPQSDSVRAFEALNRISAAIAKLNFPILKLNAKKMLPHNAVAKWLKPCIYQHEFTPHRINAVIPDDQTYKIEQFTYTPATKTGFVSGQLLNKYRPAIGSLLYIIVCDNEGYVQSATIQPPGRIGISFYAELDHAKTYHALSFIAEPKDNKSFIHGFYCKDRYDMQYSYYEQDTGDLWIDGNPIFQRTYSETIPQLTAQSRARLTFDTGFILSTLIRTEISTAFIDDNNNSTQTEGETIGANGFMRLTCMVQVNTGTGRADVFFFPDNDVLAERHTGNPITITVWYTKTLS